MTSCARRRSGITSPGDEMKMRSGMRPSHRCRSTWETAGCAEAGQPIKLCSRRSACAKPIWVFGFDGRRAMIVALYIATAVVMAGGSLYLAVRYRDVRKFLAGAFFVSAGVLFYLWLADVSVPLLGTGFVATPGSSGARAIVHFILFLLCFH